MTSKSIGEPVTVIEEDGTIKLPLRQRAADILRSAGHYTWRTLALPKGFVPLAQIFAHNQPIESGELTHALDTLFTHLYKHPVTQQTRKVTGFLREQSLLPNEGTTDELIRYVVNQCVQRSPVPVPDVVLDEFWGFYDELMSAPELKGLAELNLDITRYVLRTYEPLLIELINLLKETRRINQEMLTELVQRAMVVKTDIVIIRRQIKALRYIKPFFQTDPQDFETQARIVADMVREFGPFFIKMAQVAASNADFLPDEIARELEVFHEDVDPMMGHEVMEAFRQSFGKRPHDMYFGFDVDKPLKSGSIGSVYLARRPIQVEDRELLKRVIVKVGRHNLDREFQMGKMVLGLAIISSQYWAPHSKLAPFLQALQDQADEFVRGFLSELDFREEANRQRRFERWSHNTTIWRVPKVYRSSERVMEMEFLDDAGSLTQVLATLPAEKRKKFQRNVARKFLFTLFDHIFVYREFHGDLHPGNIMVNREGELYLIDWGNTIELDDKWGPVGDYIRGVIMGDADLVTDALINMSTMPEQNWARRDEIRAQLFETLGKKDVKRLGRNAPMVLWREGSDGIQRRIQSIMQLASNTQQMNVVIKGEYMHLSRSIAAALGSYGTLYQGLPRRMMVTDFIRAISFFPRDFVMDRLAVRRNAIRKKVADTLPLPDFVKGDEPPNVPLLK